jgi:hypothetical protein
MVMSVAKAGGYLQTGKPAAIAREAFCCMLLKGMFDTNA